MAELHEVKPGTPPAVVVILEDLLRDARDGKLRGVLVFVAQHGANQLSHIAAGDISVQEAGFIMRYVEWQHYQRGGQR